MLTERPFARYADDLLRYKTAKVLRESAVRETRAGRWWIRLRSPEHMALCAAVWMVGCSSDTFEAVLPFEGEGVLAWARLSSRGNVLDSGIQDAKELALSTLSEGERLFVGALSIGSVRDPATGQALSIDELARASLVDESSCGRCLFDTLEETSLAYSGQSCPFPPRAPQALFARGEDGLERLDGDASGVKLSWPGACACPEPIDRPLDDFEVCPLRGARDIGAIHVAVRDDGSVYGVGNAFVFRVSPSAETRFAEIRPAFGSIEGFDFLPDGRAVVSGEVRGPEVDQIDVRSIDESLEVRPILGWPAELSSISAIVDHEGFVEARGGARLGSVYGPAGARCRLDGDIVDCVLLRVVKDLACPNTYDKTSIDSLGLFDNGDGLGWVSRGFVFRAARGTAWSCVRGAVPPPIEVPGLEPAEPPGSIQLATVGRRLYACGETATKSMGARDSDPKVGLSVVLTATVPDALVEGPDGAVLPFPLRLDVVHVDRARKCSGFIHSSDGRSVWLVTSGVDNGVVKLTDGVVEASSARAAFGYDGADALYEVKGTEDRMAALSVNGQVFGRSGGSTRLQQIQAGDPERVSAVGTIDGFRVFGESESLDVRVSGPTCADVEVAPDDPFDPPHEAVVLEGGETVAVGVDSNRLILTVGGTRTDLGPASSRPRKIVSLGAGRRLVLMNDGALELVARGKASRVGGDGERYRDVSATGGVALASRIGASPRPSGLDRLAPTSETSMQAESIVPIFASSEYLAVDADRDNEPQWSAVSLECPDRGRAIALEDMDQVNYPWLTSSASAWRLSKECSEKTALCPDRAFDGFGSATPRSSEVGVAIFADLIVYSGSVQEQGTLVGRNLGLRAAPFPHVSSAIESPAGFLLISHTGRLAVVLRKH
ncbi:MAG: hypothetical protein HYV07_07875 [Deltaproteobacteria bacterium]|nr:hypothetical protein [Deltaproteobacteria bacterium]